MFKNILTNIFGKKSDRDTRKILPIVDEINVLYEEYRSLTDEQIKGKTRNLETLF